MQSRVSRDTQPRQRRRARIASRRDNESRGLPLVDAEVGALLRVLATALGARRILEIGTAIGYSGIWLAGALPPDGMLITLELDETRAREARENFARAGLADRTSVIVGDAQLKISKVAGPFDLIFQDGAKQLYSPLLDRAGRPAAASRAADHGQCLWNGEVVPGFSAHPEQNPEDTRAIARCTTNGWRPIRSFRRRSSRCATASRSRKSG